VDSRRENQENADRELGFRRQPAVSGSAEPQPPARVPRRIANFDTALLDLPFDSTRDNEHLTYEANTDAIPALETAVTVI
jgi:hypothetical protein